MKWYRREVKKIDRLSGTASRILKNTVPCRLSQHSAVTRTRVSLDKLFVREEKECLVLSAPKRWPTFAKFREVHRPADIKTIEMLPEDRLWLAIVIVQKQVSVSPGIVQLKEGSTMEFV